MFEQGKLRCAGRKVAALFCEADGAILRLQRGARKVAEAKLAIVHEGWRRLHPAGGEYRLEGKFLYAALEGPRRFWESLGVFMGQRWDFENVNVVAGDGGPERDTAPVLKDRVFLDSERTKAKGPCRAIPGRPSPPQGVTGQRSKTDLTQPDIGPMGLRPHLLDRHNRQQSSDPGDHFL